MLVIRQQEIYQDSTSYLLTLQEQFSSSLNKYIYFLIPHVLCMTLLSANKTVPHFNFVQYIKGSIHIACKFVLLKWSNLFINPGFDDAWHNDRDRIDGTIDSIF